jgi:HYR domain
MKRIGILLTLLLALSILAASPQMGGRVLAAGGDQTTTGAAAHTYSIVTSAGGAALFPQNTAPPVIQVPGMVVADATSPSGASVYYTVTASDPYDSSDQVSLYCSYAPGSMFPIGITFVTCNASDAAGTSSASFQVKVQKTTPPTLHTTSITVNTTSTQGAIVHYTVTATDSVFPSYQLAINCTPASGTNFPLGSTTVNCTVTDPVGNVGTGDFLVVVRLVKSHVQVNKYHRR